MRMGTLSTVSERLDYLIKAKNMSENAFMKATGTNNIGKMRNGRLSVTEGTISKICNSLGVSYDWLKYGIGNMNDSMRFSFNEETRRKMQDAIKEAVDNYSSIPQIVNTGYVGYNSQNISNGATRAKEREEVTIQEKNSQLIQIINAQAETIKTKDNEIHLLRKILADNGIEV